MAAADDKPARRFSALFRELSPDIIAYCRWRARSRSDAQDAVAEVFLTAWRRLDEVPEGDAARVWLYATARRVMANQRRATSRRTLLRERLAAMPVASPACENAPDPAAELVHAVLRRLKSRDREVLLLAEWEGFSPTEIASILGCTSVTARGRLYRARRRFRQAFEELEQDAEQSTIRRAEPTEHGSARRTHLAATIVRAARPAQDADRS
jgi:RNA polymerase sigma factor (sigma-70 family)